MGRTKPKKKAHSKATDPPNQHATPSNAPSIPSLLEKAQSLIVQCDYDLALRFIRRILEQAPSNAEAKEMLGVALLETGEVEGAKEVCIYLPNSVPGFNKFYQCRRSNHYCPPIPSRCLPLRRICIWLS